MLNCTETFKIYLTISIQIEVTEFAADEAVVIYIPQLVVWVIIFAVPTTLK